MPTVSVTKATVVIPLAPDMIPAAMAATETEILVVPTALAVAPIAIETLEAAWAPAPVMAAAWTVATTATATMVAPAMVRAITEAPTTDLPAIVVALKAPIATETLEAAWAPAPVMAAAWTAATTATATMVAPATARAIMAAPIMDLLQARAVVLTAAPPDETATTGAETRAAAPMAALLAEIVTGTEARVPAATGHLVTVVIHPPMEVAAHRAATAAPATELPAWAIVLASVQGRVVPITATITRILAVEAPAVRIVLMAAAMVPDLAITAVPVIMVPVTDRAGPEARLITATTTATATETSTMKTGVSLKKPLKGCALGLVATNMTTETAEAASREAITVDMRMIAINHK